MLFDRFTDFREFLDPRQDQLIDVYRAIHALENVNMNDSNDILRTISDLDVSRVHRMYQNKCNEVLYGNNNLRWALQAVSFRHCKAVIGDNDYV